jgi:hypothetical protein
MAEADGFILSLALRQELEVWHNLPVDFFIFYFYLLGNAVYAI